MEYLPVSNDDMSYPWKYGNWGIDIFTDTYLACVHGIQVMKDMFEHEVLSDTILLDRAISLYSNEITLNNNMYQMILSNKGQHVCLIKGSTKYQVCMVVYFMDMYYANESESERMISDTTGVVKPYYSYKDRDTLVEARKIKKAKKCPTIKIKRFQKAFAKAIMSDEFLELVKKNM